MTILLFLFGTVYLALGFIVFIVTTLSTIPGVGGMDNPYINKLQSWTQGGDFINYTVTIIYMILMTALWPIHLGLTMYFKKWYDIVCHMKQLVAEWWEVWYDDGHSRIKTGFPTEGKYASSIAAWEFVKSRSETKYSVIHVKRFKMGKNSRI